MSKLTSKSKNGSRIHSLSKILQKPANKITRGDLEKYVIRNDIEIISFRYVAADGRLKQLDLPATDESWLDEVLRQGERVDGSSLFGSVEVNSSDLYVVPNYGKAFLDSFAEPAKLNIICDYFDSSGKRFNIAPGYVVERAQEFFRKETGMEIYALGELEFYTIHPKGEDEIFTGSPQSNYHEALPFARGEPIRTQMMRNMTSAGLKIKYGHSEVGNISDRDGKRMVQHEIEFRLAPIEEMADQISIAKWIVRRVAYENGIEVSFAPKLEMGHAGSSLHIHSTARTLDGENSICEPDNGELNEVGKGIIGGYLDHARSLTAFGNQVPSSYLRFVPGQEAPIKICWGRRNRSALVRVPIAWQEASDLANKLNEEEEIEKETSGSKGEKQTIEIRSPDGTANPHYLLAALGVLALEGVTSEGSEKIADDLECERDIFEENRGAENEEFDNLPGSCEEAAESLREDRDVYEESGVFASEIIDGIIKKLEARGREEEDLSKESPEDLKKTFDRYLHSG